MILRGRLKIQTMILSRLKIQIILLKIQIIRLKIQTIRLKIHSMIHNDLFIFYKFIKLLIYK